MLITKFPEETQKFELQVYKKPKSIKNLRESHVPFSGSPRKHPYDPDRVILITDPYSTITSYYEFKTEDISYVQLGNPHVPFLSILDVIMFNSIEDICILLGKYRLV